MLIAKRFNVSVSSALAAESDKNLKYWFSGKHNGGKGIHLNSTTTWVNLVGDYGHAIRQSGGIDRWSANSAIFTSKDASESFKIGGLTSSTTYDSQILGQTWSIMCLFKPQSGFFQNYSGVMGGHTPGLVFLQHENSSFGTVIYNSADIGTPLNPTTAEIKVDTLYCVILKYSPTQNELWINGSMYKQGNYSTVNTLIQNPITIGNSFQFTGDTANRRNFVGDIYDVKMYNKYLSEAECIKYTREEISLI